MKNFLPHVELNNFVSDTRLTTRITATDKVSTVRREQRVRMQAFIYLYMYVCIYVWCLPHPQIYRVYFNVFVRALVCVSATIVAPIRLCSLPRLLPYAFGSTISIYTHMHTYIYLRIFFKRVCVCSTVGWQSLALSCLVVTNTFRCSWLQLVTTFSNGWSNTFTQVLAYSFHIHTSVHIYV